VSLEDIWDAIARQAAEVPGVKGAYAARASSNPPTSVLLYPDDLSDGPVAVVDYVGSEIEHGSTERMLHGFEIALKVPVGNTQRAAAVAALAPFLAKFHDVFDQNVGLYGTCHRALITGSGSFDDEAVNDKPFLVQRLDCEVIELRTQTLSLGPAS
jgi:hypothetical protein